jgi:hypothetical protein
VFYAIEAKAGPNDEATDLQKQRLKEISEAGGITVVLKGYQEDKLRLLKRIIEERAGRHESSVGQLPVSDTGGSDSDGEAGRDG